MQCGSERICTFGLAKGNNINKYIIYKSINTWHYKSQMRTSQRH